MVRHLLAVGGLVVLAAACSADADAGGVPERSCLPGDVECVLLDAEDLSAVFGGEVTVEAQNGDVAEGGAWCDRPLPDPVERADSTHVVTSDVNGVTIVVTSSLGRYAGADADLVLDAIEGLRPGCEWSEGDADLQFLSEMDAPERGDRSAGGIFRSVVRGVAEPEAHTSEVVVVQIGDLVAQVGVLPAQESALLTSSLVSLVVDRLEQVAG